MDKHQLRMESFKESLLDGEIVEDNTHSGVSVGWHFKDVFDQLLENNEDEVIDIFLGLANSPNAMSRITLVDQLIGLIDSELDKFVDGFDYDY